MHKTKAPPYGLILFFLFVSVIPSYSQSNGNSNQGVSRTWGIFIGIDKTEEGVGNGYASKSTSDFNSLWVQYQHVDSGQSVVLLNEDADKAAIQKTLAALNQAHPQDRVIVYLSMPTLVRFTGSHKATGFLIPYNGQLSDENPYSSLISVQELRDAIMASPADEILVFIDAPLSGLHATSWPAATTIPGLEKPSNTKGKHVLVAGRWGDTFSLTQEGLSPFVESISTALRTQTADSDGDRFVSFSELSHFVRNRVNEHSSGHQFVQVRSYEGSLDVSLPLGSVPGGPTIAATATIPSQPTDSIDLLIDSSPVGGSIYVDDQFLGNTPLQIRVAQWKDISVVIQQDNNPALSHVLTPDRASGGQLIIQMGGAQALLNFADVPSQHEIWINGNREPMADIEPLQLTAGDYHVAIRKGSKRIADQQLLLQPGTNNQLTFDSRFSVSPAVASFFVPGLGQFTNDARAKGIGFAAASFSALALSVVNNIEYQDSKNLFQQAQEAYLQARTPVQAGILREEMLAQYDNVLDYNDKRRNMLIIAAAIQGLSVIDALIFHSRKSVLRYEHKTGLTPFLSAHKEGMGMGLRIGL